MIMRKKYIIISASQVSHYIIINKKKNIFLFK